MFITLAVASLVATAPVSDSVVPRPADVPVRVWISSNRTFKPGEAARVQVETDRTGYLLVLHFSPEGRLSVLFPVLPGDDSRVEAGRRYEIRDEDQGTSFVAGGGGHGLVYAALSEDPWRFDEVTVDGGWNYGVLAVASETENPEADITPLVQRMASARGFDYDVIDYAVLGEGGRAYRASAPSWWTPREYGDWYDCYGCGWGPSSIFIGFGWPVGYAGWPWWYYRGYRYSYGYWGRPWYYGYHYPYYPYYGGVIVRRPHNVIVGRPRGYTIERLNPRPRSGGFDRTVTASDGSRPVIDARAPARRARGTRPDGDGARNGGDRGAVSRPGNDGGSRPAADRPQSARPRGNDRARGRGRDEMAAPAPNIERSRPAGRPGNDVVRVDTDGRARGAGDARRVEGSRPVIIDRGRPSNPDRADLPRRVDQPSRQAERFEAPARRARPAEPSRASGSGTSFRSLPQVTRGPSSGARGGESPRAPSRAVRSGGSPRASTPAIRSGGSGGSPRMTAPRASGGSSRPAASSGSSRARGRGH